MKLVDYLPTLTCDSGRRPELPIDTGALVPERTCQVTRQIRVEKLSLLRLLAVVLGGHLKGLAYSVLGLAAAGFLAALIVHVAVFWGKTYPFDVSSDYLFWGLFVVWVPTALVVNSSGLKQDRRGNLRDMLRGLPKYLQLAMWILFAYSMVLIGLESICTGEMASQLCNARAVSGAFLAMYSATASLLYSAMRAEKSS